MRTAIDVYAQLFANAYRDDRFHAFRRNLLSVQPAEWDIQPAGWSVDVFGSQPELSICDIALHVGGATVMYADRVFGDAHLEWDSIPTRPRDMDSVVAWLDEVTDHHLYHSGEINRQRALIRGSHGWDR